MDSENIPGFNNIYYKQIITDDVTGHTYLIIYYIDLDGEIKRDVILIKKNKIKNLINISCVC